MRKRSADPTSRVMALPRTDRRDLILELPVPRQQRVELVAPGLAGHDAFQRVGQPGQWFNVVELGGLDQRRDDRPMLSAAIGPGKKGVLAFMPIFP
jgi:hypothetical protein